MSKNRHGDYYNYSLSKYDGFRKKVKIICRKHGEFFQNARYHINGGGCPRCKCGGNGKGALYVDVFVGQTTIVYDCISFT